MINQATARLQAKPITLKFYLVHLGLQALRKGDMARVQLMSELLRAKGYCDA
jgi:hypothetical protein